MKEEEEKVKHAGQGVYLMLIILYIPANGRFPVHWFVAQLATPLARLWSNKLQVGTHFTPPFLRTLCSDNQSGNEPATAELRSTISSARIREELGVAKRIERRA